MSIRKAVAGGVMAVFALAAVSARAETTVGADVGSAYVFRGATFNDEAVVQPSLKATHGAFTVGVWGNYDVGDYGGAVKDNQFSEIDLYGSYAVPVEGFGLSLGYTEYVYTGSDSEADREPSVRVTLSELPLSPTLGAYYGLDGAIEKSWYFEGGLSHAFKLTEKVALALSGAVGYMEPDEGESGFSHYSVTADVSYGILHAGLTYVGQIDDKVLPDGAGAYDVDLYGLVGIAFPF